MNIVQQIEALSTQRLNEDNLLLECKEEIIRLRKVLREIAFIGMDCPPGAETGDFYRSQLCSCISLAARQLNN